MLKNKKNYNYKRKKTKNNNDFRHRKSLGQNFLHDENIIEEIIDGSGIGKETLVIEIGPGMGALTCKLAEKAAAVIAVEIDDRLIPILHRLELMYENIEIVHGDIMQINIKELVNKFKGKIPFSEIRIIGNLPYYITTPIIMKLLENDTGAKSITVMMQKEVADRLETMPGTKLCGAITYSVHYRCDVYRICDVCRECFDPEPKVDSAVLRLDIRQEKSVKPENEAFMLSCIKAGFALRRKTLLNSLSTMNGLEKNDIKEAFEEAGIDVTRRAENMTLEDFALISDILWRKKRK